ncbi:hypothetical protein [Sulfurimonas sp. C5]|uniref:hypothetical protein n=1 Tax=Sulfurimonas sp. C5 TaxID=3036947 RepID=UPI002458568C|nr:hypothetical protein [Sulfurimonas sp. C5]MDH4945314.1 hypothetical protein [Sulfurimonas sp. C5]
MFIGWIRAKNFSSDLEIFSNTITIDKSLVLKTFEQNPSLCFGAYNENKLVAFISAYEMPNSILINNFYYMNEITDDTKKRLVKLLLNNASQTNKSICVMSKKDEKTMLMAFGFKEYAKFKKAIYVGGAAAFNFSNATAKSIANENYIPTITKLDKKAFGESRMEYIRDILFKQSSLVLSTDFGYQHSYAIDKTLVKISPWIMEDAAYIDAEKILRGVIYHRGLKKLFAFIPSDVAEITNLYKTYNFNLDEEYSLLYINEKPDINLEMVYGF